MMRWPPVTGVLITLFVAALSPVTTTAHMNDEQSPYRAHITAGPLTAGATVPINVSVVKRDRTPASGLRAQMEVYRGFSRRVVFMTEKAPGNYVAEASLEPGRYQGIVRLEGSEAEMFGDLSFQVGNTGAARAQQLTNARLELRQGGFTVAPPWVDQVTWIGLIGLLVLAALYVAWRAPGSVLSRSPVVLPGWVLSIAIAGALAGPLGAYWDIAWHVNRGRETLWSPPHLLIYGGITSVPLTVGLGLLALPQGSRWQALLRHPGLRFTVVATFVTLISAPLDEFWHLTFGLDASIWSPPHLVLLFGAAFSFFGLALLAQDRISERRGWLARVPVLFLFGATLTVLLIFVNEFEWPRIEDWSVLEARPVGLYPLWYSVLTCLVLAAGARAAGKPGSATVIAGIGWGLRVGVTIGWLPVLGLPSPLLPPFLVAAGLVIDVVTAALRERTTAALSYAIGSVLATGLTFALHVPTASLMPVRSLPGAALITWLPLALVAALSTGYLGYRFGGLATRVAGLHQGVA